MKQRLSKVLASKGVASRRACEELIFAGRVKVNGEVTLVPQTMVDEDDTLNVDGQNIGKIQKKVYYILNKPVGYYCSPVPKERYKYVLDLFKEVKERLFTVGRLDRDTSGLIIVTNDGHFANKVIHPSSNIQKEYVVKTNNEITAEHLKQISEGIYIEGNLVVPVKVQKVRKGTLKVVVTDGKKREVRLLVSSAGIDVVELKRTRIGGLHLGSLKEGEWRPMKSNEMNAIFE
jgi:23S rRNA pseudouridine2605 synthase